MSDADMGSSGRPLDDLVADVTPRVLAEALEQAVEKARDELADRMARAIVQRAETGGRVTETPRADPRVPAADVPAADDGDTGLYAFAIVPAGPADLAGVTGIDGEAPLRIVQHDDLGLVVSRMRLDLLDDVSEDDLSETGALATLARRHDEVVRSVFEHGPVLPLRFGTVVADEQGGRQLLAEQAGAARRRLAHLGTRREWGVRLSHEASADEEGYDETAAADRRAMTGTSYLAARREALQRSERAERETAAVREHVEQVLREHAVDLVYRGGGAGSGLLADVAYLVAAEHEDAFLEAVARLGREVATHGLALDTTGPWPPYSFATLGSGDHTEGGVLGSA